MEVKDLAALRKNRALRKGKLTMALTELNAELKEEDVVQDQIRQLQEKSKTRLDAVENAHDMLMNGITDEDEIGQEEEWLGLVVRYFNMVTRRARKILGEVVRTPVKPISNSETSPDEQVVDNITPASVSIDDSVKEGSTDNVIVCESVIDVETPKGTDVVNNTNKSDVNVSINAGSTMPTHENSLIIMVQAMALPKAHVRKFEGDPLFYYTFMASFNNSVSCITDPSIKLNVLRSLCCGRALDATEFCVLKPPAEGLEAALTTLKKRFGNSAMIVQAWIKKIVTRPKVEPAKLESYADDLTNCFQALDALGYLQELNNQGSLKTIIDKLPRFLQQRWMRENDKVPSLKDVVRFVKTSSCEVNDPVFGTVAEPHKPSKPGERNTGRVFQTDAKMVPSETKIFSKWKKCWGCETDEHWPDQCPTLLQVTPEERMKKAKENHVCFSCFKKAGKQHSITNCRRRKKCTQCDKFHHPLLHITAQPTTQLMTLDQNSTDDVQVVMPMLTANVLGRDSNILFDTCATLTLIRDDLAKECKFPSKPVTVEISTLGSEKSLLHTRAYNVTLTSREGHSHSLTAIGVPSITDVPTISNRLRSEVEEKLGEPIYRRSGTVDILIGINYAKMHTGKCVDIDGDYVTGKSPLGWVLFGTNTKGSTRQHQNPVMLIKLAEPVDISQFWSTEEMGVEYGHWVVSYPWIKTPEELLNNEKQCFAKLCSLEKRLKETNSAEQYSRAIDDMVEKGFAKKLTEEEKGTYHGPGPDLLRNLMGVIMRFREFKIAVAGDISKMFYQVRIPPSDMHVHRFLWRKSEERSPDTYVLTIVTPGDKPAPAMALTALLKPAKENETDHPQVAATLQRDTYMDNICTSVKNEKEAIELTKEIDNVLSTAEFKVKKWVSIAKLHADQDHSEQPVMSEDTEQKVLGVVWEPKTDELKYKVQQDELHGRLTKRTVLSEISKIFDPIGFSGAFLIRAKIMVQRLWAAGVGWDDELILKINS
ncbi:uncharacterized protein LOC117110896 [Anneissia japonica]|uniref:uncharacterized protein LOC117110896 n=1 Tax=Anneissia japonica TaxID=1529436 RepID=UPI00142580DD|nr:uncharacterized protein LOC117110896 [Anneissia japonica]